MNEHDEKLFQRINQVRAKLVGELRVALKAAGMQKRAAPSFDYGKFNVPPQDGIQTMFPNANSADKGYDIERVIQGATAIRKALEPFDSSIPRLVEEVKR